MNYIVIAIVSVVIIAILVIFYLLIVRKRRVLNKRYFQNKWKQLQSQCLNKKSWYQVIIDADNLLDEALTKRHFSGKSTGEKLVSAQHEFTINKELWSAHNFKKKIVENQITKLNKKETIAALNTFRQALSELGAINLKKSIKKEKRGTSLKKI